mmetsp:Transcript_7239/g.24301  ORF Transcript_7239/g.24301 Transcript_7239/m.24301 type:complete len:292 (+) Transcript_7239:214-1089(+)
MLTSCASCASMGTMARLHMADSVWSALTSNSYARAMSRKMARASASRRCLRWRLESEYSSHNSGFVNAMTASLGMHVRMSWNSSMFALANARSRRTISRTYPSATSSAASAASNVSRAAVKSSISASSTTARMTVRRSCVPLNPHATTTWAAAWAPPRSRRVSARTAAAGAPTAKCALAVASIPPRASSAAASSRRTSNSNASVGRIRAAASAAASRMSPPRRKVRMAPQTSWRDNRNNAARWCSPASTSRSHCALATTDHTSCPPPMNSDMSSLEIGASPALRMRDAAPA